MQGLEPGALNFNDAIVQESLANQPTPEMLAEVGAAACCVGQGAAVPAALQLARRLHPLGRQLRPCKHRAAGWPRASCWRVCHARKCSIGPTRVHSDAHR